LERGEWDWRLLEEEEEAPEGRAVGKERRVGTRQKGTGGLAERVEGGRAEFGRRGERMDLLADDNVAGQNLLSIVSRGSAIIAEMLRLSDNIPPEFSLPDANNTSASPTKGAAASKYSAVIFDFSYLRNPELHESRIGGDIDLSDLDEELRESLLPMIERFYSLFESVFKYISDLNRFLQDVDDGVYIQLRLEDLLVSSSGKQLLSESLHLYGVMLTVMDSRIDGPIRERLLIAHYRYKGSSETHSNVCRLCRSTGYHPLVARRPPSYPEDYFARLPPPQRVVMMVVNRLRSDDIYNQMKEWPDPTHRCTALQTQAAMVYVMLYFVPQVLHKEHSIMREIVDRHLSDCWVLPFYMGFIVDLSVMWEPYRAAMAALGNTVDSRRVRDVNARHVAAMGERINQLRTLLTEGTLTEDYVLDNWGALLNVLREANAELRWVMLHRKCQQKRLREAAWAGLKEEGVLTVLVQTAQLEFLVGRELKALIGGKEGRWQALRADCAERMGELASFFSGSKELTRVKRDERLEQWFKQLQGVIEGLEHGDSTLAGRKIQQLMSAIKDVGQFHQIEGNASVRLFLEDAHGQLRQMLRLVNIKEDLLIALATVSDFSFAFALIRDYMPHMHHLIKSDPFAVLLLRATFLKLATVLDLPLVRINQAGSEDLASVAQYYSSQLVDFLRAVLEVVPVNMFRVLNDIIQVHTGSLKELPPRLERQGMKDYAQLEQRYLLARATQQVSVLTEGILAMEATLLGIVEADPKRLLQDGIRKELCRQISHALHTMIEFREEGRKGELELRLEGLQAHLDGFRRSFEYISDYVNMYGLKVWQEEFARIVNFSVEQECNAYLKKKVYPWQSRFQSRAIPIPVYPPLDNNAATFVGRLVREILALTDANACTYLDASSGWHDSSGKEVTMIMIMIIMVVMMIMTGQRVSKSPNWGGTPRLSPPTLRRCWVLGRRACCTSRLALRE